ncbi:MAG: Cof-type HAD-IIB family hydrolase [Clostridia bacterium]|nr:Cof-type HAD-IIB family hydrolase [Clostridia bacterium]
MNYKIIACDLDGTLLNSKMEVTKENLQAIKELGERGVIFVPCTGRTYAEVPEEIRELPGVRYFIHSGGAVVYDKKTGERIEMCMTREKCDIVLNKVAEYHTFTVVRYDGKSYVNKETHNEECYVEHRLSENCRRFLFTTNNAIDNFKEFSYSVSPVEATCTYFKYQEEQDECREFFEKTGLFQVVSSEPYNIECLDSTSGKGVALLKLAEKLGIDRSETIAVGDSKNDENSITLAGLGLAMKNASDELKKLADKVVCSNDEHVVKYILENIIK